MQECVDFINDHPDLPGLECTYNAFFDRFEVAALRDAMNRTAAPGDPADRTVDISRPFDSFQRACERRPLNVLTDPGLTP
jgi:hypothetical protein